MSDVTQILSQIESGDPSVADQLLPLVYEELRRLAAVRMTHENAGHSMQATALVHEAYLRLVDVERAQQWNSRGHFFAAAAEAMRRIVIERARQKLAVKHGGARQRVDFDHVALVANEADDNLIALDEALTQLAQREPEASVVVKLRYFAGLTIIETAEARNISVATANRHWGFARAWLYAKLS